MKAKQRAKMMLDLVMTLLFFAEMAYHLEGNFLHEWLGVLLILLFAVHNIWNRNWYKGIFRGKYPPVRMLMLLVNLLFLLSMVGAAVSGMMLSRDALAFLNLRAGMFGRRLHMVSTSWGFLLMTMHIGLHWGMMARGMKKHLPPALLKWRRVVQVLVMLICVYGIYALIERQLIDRMFLLMEYAFFDYEEPAVFFFADYVCILILFAAISFWLTKLLGKKARKQ